MDAFEFAISLSRLCPSDEYFEKSGLSEAHISFMKKSFNLELINKTFDKSPKKGAIDELISYYNVEFLRFSDFSFEKEITEKNDCYIFCGSSHSFLCIMKDSNKILEIDYEENSILSECAKDQSSFLRALLVYLEYFSFRYQDIISKNEVLLKEKYLDRACLAAGGKQYIRFFKTLFR